MLGEADFLKCPYCNHFYGVKKGLCPSGTMTIGRSANKLPGYGNSEGTWNISYRMESGKTPDTNISYSGEGRNAYLPICAEGDEILALF